MRSIFLLLILALPLKAQDLTVPCEAPAKTLRLLEDVAPLRDVTIPYESRIGALRALAKQYPEDCLEPQIEPWLTRFNHAACLASDTESAVTINEMNLKKEKGPRVSQHHIGLERAANISAPSSRRGNFSLDIPSYRTRKRVT